MGADYYPTNFFTSTQSTIWWLSGPLDESNVAGLNDPQDYVPQRNDGLSSYHVINYNTWEFLADPLPAVANAANTTTTSLTASASISVLPAGSTSSALVADQTQREEAIGTMKILRTYIYEQPPGAPFNLSEFKAYDGPSFTLVKTAAWSTTTTTATANPDIDSHFLGDDDLPAGTIVGAVIGVLILVFLIVLLAWLCGCCCAGCCRRRRRREPEVPLPEQPRTMALRESVDVESRASDAGEPRPINDRPSGWVFPSSIDSEQAVQRPEETTAPMGRSEEPELEEPLPIYEPPPKYSKFDENSRAAR